MEKFDNLVKLYTSVWSTVFDLQNIQNIQIQKYSSMWYEQPQH